MEGKTVSDYTLNTKCVQAGYTPGNGEPRQIPIIQSTTFKYDTSEDMGSYLIWKHPVIFIAVYRIQQMIMLQQRLQNLKAVQQQC